MSTLAFMDSLSYLDSSRKFPDKHKSVMKLIKKMRFLNNKYSHKFLKGPDYFYKKASEVSAEHPDLNLSIRISGLSVLEGKGSHKKVRNLLLFLSDFGYDWKYLIDILLEKIVSGYFNRNEENLGKVGLEVQQLLKVFGTYEVRTDFISKRYSKHQRTVYKEHGAKLCENLIIQYFDTRIPKRKEFKRGYSDHGSLRPKHKIIEEVLEMDEENNERRSIEDILTEIYKKSTENYLEWLENQSNKKTKNTINLHQPKGENKDE